ncbi:hypothetical protein HORIV_00730 [Vreelandella olivaria]|uniref:Uncharacterized protein n=1 Tax=Vreelandella olivaria TaxID=390919 RepID=A0ABM7GAX0_9GAMM|nr:hypothetical protein HORIV_00730 [Halomonas olivaria]
MRAATRSKWSTLSRFNESTVNKWWLIAILGTVVERAVDSASVTVNQAGAEGVSFR